MPTYKAIQGNHVSAKRDLNAINIINQSPKANEKVTVGMYNFCDLDNKPYVGHGSYLADIQNWCSQRRGASGNQEADSIGNNSYVVSGMAGVGKSTLLRRLVKLATANRDYENVVWIPAETRESMRNTFVNLLHTKLRIFSRDRDGLPKDDSIIVDQAYSKLLDFTTLIIFDNANCYRDETPATSIDSSDRIPEDSSFDGIAEFLPKSVKPPQKYPQILISSRNQKWKTLTDNIADVKELLEEDCEEYITKRLEDIQDVSANWQSLAKYFGNLIIAIESAVDAILFQSELNQTVNETYTIQNLLTDLQENEAAETADDYEDGENPVNITYKRLNVLWKTTFDMLQNKNKHGQMALQILDTLSFLSPSGVPKILLEAITDYSSSSASEQQKIKLALHVLQSLSLLIPANDCVRVHRLLQQTRLRMMTRSGTLEEQYLKFCAHYSDTLELLTYKSPNCQYLVDNAMHVYFLLLNYVKIVAKESVPCQLLFDILKKLHDFDLQFVFQGYKTLETLLSSFNEDLSKNPIIYVLKLNLLEVSIILGRYTEALELAPTIIDDTTRALGSSDRVTLGACRLHAIVLQKLGYFDEALTLYEKVYDQSCKHLGPTSKFTLQLKGDIGFVLVDQVKYEPALQILNETYSLLEKHHSKDVLNLLDCGDNIAMCLLKAGKLQEAETMLQNIHECKTEKVGESHPSSFYTKQLLAFAQQSLGNPEMIVNMIAEVSACSLSSFRIELILMVKSNTVRGLLSQKKYEEALHASQETYDFACRLLGWDHHETLYLKTHIGNVFQQWGKYGEALQVFQDVYTLVCEKMSQNHPRCLSVKLSIGISFQNLEIYEKALEIYEHLLAIQSNHLGDGNIHCISIRRRIAEIFYIQGKYEQSSRALQELLVLERKSDAVSPSDIRRTKIILEQSRKRWKIQQQQSKQHRRH